MSLMKIFLAPLVGGIIGYITNDLAIKMLFHPRKAVYIGKWHVPFTPGLIPQQKERIAMSIGRVISSQLLNEETIKQTIVSEKTVQLMKDKINGMLSKFKEDTRTVEEFLGNYIPQEQIQVHKDTIRQHGTQFLVQKIEQGDIGTKMVQQAMNVLQEKLKTSIMGIFIDEAFCKSIEEPIGKVVNEMIAEKAPEMIDAEIVKLEDDVLETKMQTIYEMQQQHMPTLADEIVKLYQTTIDNYLGNVLEAVDIENIVVEKVRSFDAEQLEQMIFGIMKKELNAIVYLGAILGFLMGFINLLW